MTPPAATATVPATVPGPAPARAHLLGLDTKRQLPELQPLSFTLPPELEAPSPPEARGMTRDAVRMMVAFRHDGSIVHSHFSELPRFLDEGDLVVLNTSGTLAAELDGQGPDGAALQVHLSTQLPAGLWTVEVRRDGQADLTQTAGTPIGLAGGGTVCSVGALLPRSR